MLMRRYSWALAPAAIVVSVVSGYGAQYFSTEEAQRILFPGADGFDRLTVELSKDQMKRIQKASKIAVRNNKVAVWNVKKGESVVGTFWVDQVIGKHEFITYAVGLNADGSVKQVEIMDYRETYGYQVREAGWRKQFVGKKSSDRVKLGQDVQNISGATLSCRNITDGVKRILATHEIILKK